MKFYLAYGSCLNSKSITETLAEFEYEKELNTVGIAKLNGYRLAFTRKSIGRGGGVLDIIPSKDDYVLGVVYKLSERAARAIDIREGAPKHYRREFIDVEMDGKIQTVYTYSVVDKLPEEIPPSNAYLEEVLEGMREHNFPDEYIEKYLLKPWGHNLNQKINNKIIDNVEVYDASKYLEQQSISMVAGMPKTLRDFLKIKLGDQVVLEYKGQQVKVTVYPTDKRLLEGGSSQADNPDKHICIPKSVRSILGLNEIKDNDRNELPSFRKKFSPITIRKE